MELAREGWKTLKEVDRLVKLYPECGNQDKIDGKWVMFHVKEAGRNTSTRAGDGTGGQFTKHTAPPPIIVSHKKKVMGIQKTPLSLLRQTAYVLV